MMRMLMVAGGGGYVIHWALPLGENTRTGLRENLRIYGNMYRYTGEFTGIRESLRVYGRIYLRATQDDSKAPNDSR